MKYSYLKGSNVDFANNITFDCIEEARNFATRNGVIKSYRKPIIEDAGSSEELPKIKLDVKKPIFCKEDDKEAKFIYSNDKSYVFDVVGTIKIATIEDVDDAFYNKPEIKTSIEMLDSAWKRACNAGSLWASPTQLFYMAIEQLVKDGVVDMNKVYEVKQ